MSTLPGRDHTSRSTPSLDGKGGTDSASQDGMPTKRTGPNYVYYRLYTKLGPFKSNHPLYYNDRFIGRLPSKSFAPPHTVASIKWSLCKLEGLSAPKNALLFISLSNPTPKEDSARLSLYAPSGPGLSEQNPLVLVVESEKRTKEVLQAEKLPEHPDDTDVHYVHYRVYSSKGGDQKAKTSFDQTDISLGRINTLFIAPPHTAGSLKARIAQIEGLVTPGHALYKDMELFQDMNSDVAMSDSDVISFQSDTYPGSEEGDPVALVNATANSDVPDSKFTKRVRVLTGTTADHNKYDSAWLSITNNEIVYTDGVSVSKSYSPYGDNSTYKGYMVINSKGEKGFVANDYLALD